MPSVERISLANGGSVQSEGNFATQDELEIEVRNGGIIDVRALAADYKNSAPFVLAVCQLPNGPGGNRLCL